MWCEALLGEVVFGMRGLGLVERSWPAANSGAPGQYNRYRASDCWGATTSPAMTTA